MLDSIRFGPAGNSQNFAAAGYKSTLDAPIWLAKLGLNAYEFQCGHGVRVSDASALAMKSAAETYDIKLSVHAPYYISMSSTDPLKREKSVEYILQTARIAKTMGADRIVVHSGSCAKISRGEALELACITMKNAIAALKNEKLDDVHICPEVMGKINQLGTLDEVIELCKIDEQIIPCVDFGHYNARTLGGLKSYDDYNSIFDKISSSLGDFRARNFHIHFSKIEYTAGGEKRHLTFDDQVYGPDFTFLAQVLLSRAALPTIICESAGSQDLDALAMKTIYENFKHTEERAL